MNARLAVVALICVPFLASCKGGQGPLSLEILCAIDAAGPDGAGDVLADGDAEDLDLAGRDIDIVGTDDGDVARPDGLVEIPDNGGDAGRDIPPGELGAACLQNNECRSGYCIEGPEGFVCTQICVEECPEGWYCRTYTIGSDTQSLCAPAGANLCRPCLTDAGCGDGVCLDLPEGRYCGRDCSVSACPTGHACNELELPNGLTSRQCVPVNNTCSCRAATEGQERPCLRENDIGRCLGIERCEPELGWTGCDARTPQAEECNGVDDDCDSVADDGPVPPAPSCTNDIPDLGSCPGVFACRGEAGWTCVGPLPTLDACNYLDDDCDGTTDEDFRDGAGRYVDFDNCGTCGQSCAGRIPFAKEIACDADRPTPACVVVACQDGYVKLEDNACVPLLSSLCVPCQEDANCGAGNDRCIEMGTLKFCGRDCAEGSIHGTECPNGYVCEAFGDPVRQCVPQSRTCECTSANAGITRLCLRTNALGTCGGTEVCDPQAGWTNCTARDPAAEACNGLDDDCDGFVDDGAPPPLEPCARTAVDPVGGGTWTCTAEWSCRDAGTGTDWVCDAALPVAEACNGRDDNCDGRVDEDFKVPGTEKYGDFDHCGACGVSCEGLVPNANMACNPLPAVPTCVVDTCEPGWWKSSDLACSEFPATLCVACGSDRACQVPGDTCEEVDGGGGRCLWDCSPDSLHPVVDPDRKTCPEGYACRETDGNGEPFFKCVPLSGACDCLAGDLGRERLCVIQNPFGRCVGEEACDPAQGWTGCTALTPAAEQCNAVDDDCNGLTDESWPSLGAVCTLGVGTCAATGTFRCDGGTSVACSAVPGDPVSESCNGVDDDCNGLVDDAFPDKGKPCAVGMGDCLSAGVLVCRPDGLGLDCNAVPGTPGVERCNDRDDNCNGDIDEDWPQKGRSCTSGVGDCATNGVNVCAADGLTLVCDAAPPAGGTETCNGRDDDCDGTVDEDWPTKGEVCEVGEGSCRRIGTRVCSEGGDALVCNAEAGVETPETCNGADDDCDGSIDEDWEDKGQACQAGVGECLRNGVNVCTTDGTGIRCNAVAVTPGTESCNGLDDNCDGAVDDGFDNKGQVCTRGLGQCLRSGTFACTADGTGTTCSAPVVTGNATDVCDGLDDDCDGTVDDGYANKGQACSLGLGACRRDGVFVCSADGTGTTCDAAVVTGNATDLCDGLDDDCDGVIDDGHADKGQVCSRGLGECLRTGTFVCLADGSGTTCSAPTVAGNATDLCDGLDDDCDGTVDDGHPTKGQVCTRGLGECLRTGTFVCLADGSGTTCSAPIVAGSAVDSCDGLDDDCDGTIDDGYANKGQACSLGLGECRRAGVFICSADGSGTTCNAAAVTGNATDLCDGLDDDCDGTVDDGYANKGQACTRGLGQCLRTGTFVCLADGTGTTCSAPTVTGNVTDLCDGLDDDCDGTVDDGYPNKGQVCIRGLGECRREGVFACLADGSGTTCDAAVVTGNATDLCDGLDDDCDGTVDDGYPNKGQVCTRGLGECRREGVFACLANGSGTTCNAPVVTGNVTDLCDDLDDDCDGTVDDGYPNKGQVCTAGLGQCQAAGTYVCNVAQTGTECNADTGTATGESCNYLDDDCDGFTDEDFMVGGRYVANDGCGNCFTDCTQIWTPAASNANGICNAAPADPTCTYVCLAGYVDADTNPDNGCELFVDPLAIYVATPVNGGNDFGTCGDFQTPCATIGFGIGRAQNTARNKVLVSEGIYAENVTLLGGISVLGGHNAATWLRESETNISVINGTTAAPGKHLKAVVADGITAATEFSGFTIYGEANFYRVAGDSGGNSYAIWIRDSSSNLVVQDNIVYGGRASSGSAAIPGVTGVNGVDGTNGLDGQATGSDTCVGGVPRTGGTGGGSPCGAGGGAGATSVCPSNNSEQAAGTSGTAVVGGAAAGAGGVGGNDAKVPNTPCNQPIYASGTTKFGAFGTAGGDGTDGTGGPGCVLNSGSVASGEWVGAAGTPGTGGVTGGGGGGGGAGGGVDVNTGLNCNAGDTLGGGGGGGGGGGCGGSGGGTGQPGGGSFALFVVRTGVLATAPVIRNNVLVRNQAGAGGPGGDGGIGGAGGKGGQGGDVAGLYYEFAAGTGGFGGVGGDGGHGGGGGGGCGGSSFGLFTSNLAALAPTYCTVQGNAFSAVGGAGSGGPGGQSNAAPGTSGLAGEAVSCRVQ